jgi:hypothetical protein
MVIFPPPGHDANFAADQRRWTALIAIRYQTLGVAAPQPGTFWRGNVARTRPTNADPNALERTAWSTAPGMRRPDDAIAFGELHFAEDP